MNLTLNSDFGLPLPECTADYNVVKGQFKYYHYNCDGINDRGWGCGYRTLQTICSWINNKLEFSNSSDKIKVPSISEIQSALVDIGDKGSDFIGSREWIGSVEVAYCLDYFFKVQCKIKHAKNLIDLQQLTDDISKHFLHYGSPIMMGGNIDCSSKGIFGLSKTCDEIYLLVLDPHYCGNCLRKDLLIKEGWIKWKNLKSFNECSFYNLCFPLIKSSS